jgi:hypothetical protein
MGIGRGLRPPSSHTTVRTGHVYGGSADSVRVLCAPQQERLLLACQLRVHPRHRTSPDTSPDANSLLHYRPWLLSTVQAFSALRTPTMPSVDCCGAVREDTAALGPLPGHTADVPGAVAVPSVPRHLIYQARPNEDGGLCCSVPTRPQRATPRIRFVFLAPHMRSTLLLDPASRRCPCASLVLRLHVHLYRGLPPPSTTTCPAHTPKLSHAGIASPAATG